MPPPVPQQCSEWKVKGSRWTVTGNLGIVPFSQVRINLDTGIKLQEALQTKYRVCIYLRRATAWQQPIEDGATTHSSYPSDCICTRLRDVASHNIQKFMQEYWKTSSSEEWPTETYSGPSSRPSWHQLDLAKVSLQSFLGQYSMRVGENELGCDNQMVFHINRFSN